MAVSLKRRLLTLSEYHRMAEVGILSDEDRVELLNGEIIQMSPIGSRHAANVKRINQLLSQLIAGKLLIGVQDPIALGNHSEPEPDIVVLKPVDDFYASHHPTAEDVLLVIEVSDSTLQKDKEVKIPLYADAGIPEAWIINLEENQVECFRTPENGTYQSHVIFSYEDTLNFNPFNLAINASDLLG